MNNTLAHIDIHGFKKFEHFEMTFCPGINILIGENEAGKSTILQAIQLVINQTYRISDKSILMDLFSRKNIDAFLHSPSIETLPRITIELEFHLESQSKNAQWFFGENYQGFRDGDDPKFGIRFVCEFDKELGSAVIDEVQHGQIPIEYYTLRWTTFAGNVYQSLRKPLEFLTIDTTEGGPSAAFNAFTRALFTASCDEPTRLKAKNEFRNRLRTEFEQINMPALSSGRRFDLDEKKISFESILAVRENAILLENKGRGMECFIKTQIALDKRGTNIDVVTLEEPENHLSYVNLRKMIQEISRKTDECQLIIATHSDMIATRLGINNIQWISDDRSPRKFDDVEDADAKFFKKTDNSNLLDFILARKVILVEGPTEYLLVPYLYQRETGRTLEEDEITVISCGGIRFKRYLGIAKNLKKKVAVLTDNDGKQDRVEKYAQLNGPNSLHRIFTGKTISLPNWEACLFAANKETITKAFSIIWPDETCDVDSEERILKLMSEEKVETAYKMVELGLDLEPPQYLQEAIQWLNA